MAIQALGKITVPTPGTAVAVASLLQPLTRSPIIHAILIQVNPANTGRCFVGTKGVVGSTLTNVLGILAVPTDNFIPTYSAALTIAPNGLSVNEFWIDVEVGGEGVIVSTLIT